MAKIIVACPTPEMLVTANELINVANIDAKAILTAPQSVLQSVLDEYKKGALVCVARGNQARVLKKESDIPICEIILSGQEIATILSQAKKMVNKARPRIALVGFRYMFSSPDVFCDILNVDVGIYYALDALDVDNVVQRALEEDCDVIVGGEMACKAALKRNVPHMFMTGGRDSILAALKEAKHMVYSIEQEKKNASEVMSLLNYSFQAIVKLDSLGNVVAMNFIAEKALKAPAAQIVGKNVRQLLDIDEGGMLDEALREYKNLYSTVVRKGSDSFIANLCCIQPLDKPEGFILSMQEFRQIVEMEEHVRTTRVKQGYTAEGCFSDIKTRSACMQEVIGNARQLAQYDLPILICGPAGAKLRVFAESIHNASLRKGKPFVTADLMVLPPPMQKLFFCGDPEFKSEGAFRWAYTGTLFIHCIDRLEVELQHQLLSVLKYGRLMRRDGVLLQPVDTTVICTTSVDLEELVGKGMFLEELYEEICMLTLDIPALRRHAEDIPMLLDLYLDEFTHEYHKYLELTLEARNLIYEYPWEGDEAQLRLFCRRIVLLCQDKVVGKDFIEQNLPERHAEIGQSPSFVVASNEEAEIRSALAQCDGNRKRVADILGISVTTLWRRMKKYGLE